MKPGSQAGEHAGPAQAGAGPLVDLQRVGKRFGATTVLAEVTLAIPAGGCHALIGPNGAGKSTLFDLLTGHQQASAGSIAIDGQPVRGWPPHRIRALGVARSFQVPRLFERMTVRDHLRCGALAVEPGAARPWGRVSRRRDLDLRADETMAQLDLEPQAGQRAEQLTEPQRRALDIGLALVAGARLLLLDEPTAGLDAGEAARMLALLRRLGGIATVVMIEHDLRVVFDVARSVSVLAGGRILASGPPDAVRADPRVQAAYLGRADGPPAKGARC